jgi:hypothetical protein
MNSPVLEQDPLNTFFSSNGGRNREDDIQEEIIDDFAILTFKYVDDLKVGVFFVENLT